MRKPHNRSAPVDAARFGDWQSRFHGYRDPVGQAEIVSWLGQFESSDRDAAARILDATEFLSDSAIETAFKSAVEGLPGWSKDPTQRIGRWFFIPLAKSTGESGDSMLYTLRNAAGLNSAKHNGLFIHKSELLQHLPTPEDTVVFVDDFSGTGNQAVNNWTVLRELLPLGPQVYLIFAAAAEKAIASILARVGPDARIGVVAQHRLGPEDHFFEDACHWFSSAEKARILKYCKRAEPTRSKGYGECGFLFVLAHQCPNNSLPILHSSGRRHKKGQHGFRGLFKRRT